MNYVVLGGGTAGWLTALFIKKCFPHESVSLIRCDQIPTVGVGEATTPNIISFLHFLRINPLELIKHTKGSIKTGISFENWNGDGDKYYHSFSDSIVNFNIKNVFEGNQTKNFDFYQKNLISNNLSFKEYEYATKLAYENKIDLNRTAWALHFDTSKLSNYLESIGLQRGIRVIKGKYKRVELDNSENIKSVVLEDGNSVDRSEERRVGKEC
jgi:tryptophan halogenase